MTVLFSVIKSLKYLNPSPQLHSISVFHSSPHIHIFHSFRFPPSLLSSHYPCILNFMKLHITPFWEGRGDGNSVFLIPASPPHSLIPRQKVFYLSSCLLLVLHVAMLPRPNWGSIHIVYEKQKDDDVMSCLDSMQMNKVHKNLSQACLQYFHSHVTTCTHADIHTETHTSTHTFNKPSTQSGRQSGNDYGNDNNHGCHHCLLHHVKN